MNQEHKKSFCQFENLSQECIIVQLTFQLKWCLAVPTYDRSILDNDRGFNMKY